MRPREPDVNSFLLIVVVGLLFTGALTLIVIVAIAVWWLEADEAHDQLTGPGPAPGDDPGIARREE
jgi:hypothetical protein